MSDLVLGATLKDGISPQLANIGRKLKGMDDSFSRTGKSVSGIEGMLKSAGLAAAAFAAIRFAQGSIMEAAKWERLTVAIQGIEGGVKPGAAAMERLVELSKMPGLGLEQVTAGFLRLRAAGVGAQQTEQIIRNFGNAIASFGGGADEFDRVSRQLSQMLAKGRVLQEDISTISESMPNISELMQKAFGTKNVENIRAMGIGAEEFVKRITEMAGTIPQAGRTTGDAIDDLNTSWSRFRAALVDTETVKGAVSAMSDALDTLTQAFTRSDASINKTALFKAFMTGGLPAVFAQLSSGAALQDDSARGQIMRRMEGRQGDIEGQRQAIARLRNGLQGRGTASTIARAEAEIAAMLKAQVADRHTLVKLNAQEAKESEDRAAKEKAEADRKAKEAAQGAQLQEANKRRAEELAELKRQEAEWQRNLNELLAEGAKVNNAQMQLRGEMAAKAEEDLRIASNAKVKAEADARKAQEDAIIEQEDRLKKEMEANAEAWRNYAQGFAGNLESTMAGAFELIGKKGENLWDNLAEGFRAMLARMAAEMAARALVFGLFSMFTGGAGVLTGGAPGGVLSYLLGGAMGGTAPGGLTGGARGDAGLNLVVNLTGGATKRDAANIATAVAEAQRSRRSAVV